MVVVVSSRYLLDLPKFFLLGAPFSIFLWSTYFTSVWVWVYAFSGVLVSVTRPLTQGMVFFRKTFDVENKPLSSMGYVVGGSFAARQSPCWLNSNSGW